MMENMTQDSTNHCPQCIQECDYMKFKKELLEIKKLTPNSKYDWGNDYLYCTKIDYKTNCKGEQAFSDFFYDENDTFFDTGFYNLDECMSQQSKSSKEQRAEMYKNAIIVNLRFMEPEVDMVDVKYTLMDKIANFGGKFGIFAQLTGWSLLGILNLCLVLFKNTITSRD